MKRYMSDFNPEKGQASMAAKRAAADVPPSPPQP
jgi:hypothetical protein